MKQSGERSDHHFPSLCYHSLAQIDVVKNDCMARIEPACFFKEIALNHQARAGHRRHRAHLAQFLPGAWIGLRLATIRMNPRL